MFTISHTIEAKYIIVLKGCFQLFTEYREARRKNVIFTSKYLKDTYFGEFSLNFINSHLTKIYVFGIFSKYLNLIRTAQKEEMKSVYFYLFSNFSKLVFTKISTLNRHYLHKFLVLSLLKTMLFLK